MTTAAVEQTAPRPLPRGRRGMRWVVGILVAILLLAGAAFWRAHSIADATIERHLQSFRAALARLRATSYPRPALESPYETGDGQDLVLALVTAMNAMPEGDWRVVEEFDLVPGNRHDPKLERAMIERVKPSLDGLDHVWRRGHSASPPADLGSGLASGSIDIARARSLRRVLSAAARLALATGDGEAAIRYATDQALVGQDMARRATLLTTLEGVETEGAAMFMLAEIVKGARLPGEALGRLAKRLEELRNARPPLDPVWSVERTLLGGILSDESRTAIHVGFETARQSGSLRTWRTLYSNRIARSNALRALESLPDSVPVELSREPMEGATARALDDCRISVDDPIFWDFFVVWPILFHKLRERDARQAVLELATAIARFEAERGRWPAAETDLVPAYLTAIPSSPYDPAGLRFAGSMAWSRGPDGDDDGGKPLPDPRVIDGDGDVVVEVKGHR